MTPEQVAHIRQINNNIEVNYVFEDKEGSAPEHIPNPIETFEQAFGVSKNI